MPSLTEEKFTELLQGRLTPPHWKRALATFRACGRNLALDVTNVLLHAAKEGADKVDEMLAIIEEHEREHLCFQHPDIRGMVSNALLGTNPTEYMFLRICRDVLKLEPNPT